MKCNTVNKINPIPLSTIDPNHFWSRVDKTPGHGPKGECWIWKAKRLPKGYGVYWHKGKEYLAHRIAYALHHIKDLGSLMGLHSCDYPPCCNPSHIFPGTIKDNAVDALRKGRLRSGAFLSQYMRKHARRGETHPCAKLTAFQVLEIRAKYRPNEYGYKKLAKEYGVKMITIHAIIKRITWKDI